MDVVSQAGNGPQWGDQGSGVRDQEPRQSNQPPTPDPRSLRPMLEAYRARVRGEAGGVAAREVEHAFRLALGRNPSPREAQGSANLVRLHGLSALCRALVNTNERRVSVNGP